MIRPIVALNVVNEDNGKTKTIYAMLDSGSDRDVVSELLAQELDLKQTTKTVTIQTVNSTITATRQFVDMRIEAVDESYGADVIEALSGNLLTSDNDTPPSKRDFTN